MRLRFRVGPFTFGRSGTRLSLWSGGTGVSIPLSKKKGQTFGKVNVGPVSAYFDGSSTKHRNQAIKDNKEYSIDSNEGIAIEAFGSDQQFLEKLLNNGMPWRGVQERLKEELPENTSNRDNVAYKLVPKAMSAIFGQQNTDWKTEKRPSKNGKGLTTWVVVINTSA